MKIRLLLGFAAVLAVLPLAAWENHSMITEAAFADEAQAAARVKAEPLDQFLSAEPGRLAALLAKIETEAASRLEYHSPLSPVLAFAPRPGEAAPALRLAFLRAIRVNPATPFPLFVQLPPGAAHGGRAPLAIEAVNPMGSRLPNPPFGRLLPGEEVTVLEVVASASDEPDYGMDVGLYADNGKPMGLEYGFGKQPFGNPALSYGSQAPFHMAFPHEDPLIKLAASFTTRSLSAYRTLQYTELARFAFDSGHPYWGWRFAGWALHYVQDLAQPYHASMLPGMSAFQIIWLNLTGSPAAKNDALVLLSNRHTVIEDYLYHALSAAGAEDSPLAAPLAAALRKSASSPRVEPWRAGYAYDVVAWASYRRGPAFDRLVSETFPVAYVSDPSYDYGAAGYAHDPYAELHASSPDKAAVFERASAAIFADLGSWTRNYLEYVASSAAQEGARRAPLDPRGPGYIAAAAALIAALVFLLTRKRRRGI